MTTDTDMFLLEAFSSPFMQRALLSGLMLGIILASLGIFVTLRKMAFFGDGIAHSSLAGIAIAVLAGLSPLPVAMVWAVAVALFIYWLERKTKLPSDTVIGILFTASMALGVVLMSLTRGYQPELISYLFGSILAIRNADLATIAVCGTVIMAWLLTSFRELTYMSLAEENAIVAGVPVRIHTPILYVALAISPVLGVKILGIILASALLILPSAVSRQLTGSFKGFFLFALLCAELMIAVGLTLSFLYDLPSGATIILVGTAMFFLATVIKRIPVK